MDVEGDTMSVYFSCHVSTYDFVNRRDGDCFPKVFFLQTGDCKTKDVSIQNTVVNSYASRLSEEAWDLTECTVTAQKANKRIHSYIIFKNLS